jgi:hypothetical protein
LMEALPVLGLWVPPLLRVSSLLGVPPPRFSLGFVYQAFDVGRIFLL